MYEPQGATREPPKWFFRRGGGEGGRLRGDGERCQERSYFSPLLTLMRMTKDEKGLAFFKGLLL
jgi:hypothetical protein